jgi:hypothetical protein
MMLQRFRLYNGGHPPLPVGFGGFVKAGANIGAIIVFGEDHSSFPHRTMNPNPHEVDVLPEHLGRTPFVSVQ